MDATSAELSKARLAREDIHEQWEDDYLNADLDKFYDIAFDRILAELGDTEGKALLDIGCGYCYHTRRMLKGGFQITATDFSAVPLEHARTTIAGHEDRVTLQQADATDLPFPDASFDCILMWGVLMHIPDATKALSEMARVLRPGGHLVLSEINRWSFDAAVVESLVNAVRGLVGKGARDRDKTSLGIEEWHDAKEGRLVVRKTDMAALDALCATLGLRLEMRFAGQFTEIYTRISPRALKRAAHAFNRFWFRYIRTPAFATGNVLIFRKAEPGERPPSGTA